DLLNEVLRWKLNANLERFGGYGIEVKKREIPLITSFYYDIDWQKTDHIRSRNADKTNRLHNLLKADLGDDYITVCCDDDKQRQHKSLYYTSKPFRMIGPPKIRSIEVDNYQGIITVVSEDVNKIEWILDGKVFKRKYNVVGKFTTTLKVENIEGKHLLFRLVGDGGKTYSHVFDLTKIS
ncbi:MAG: hypothetical protein FWC11_01795, partial [Firmicutes bacterium]|nr:hypothetical protein [Bacillota bacterium]